MTEQKSKLGIDLVRAIEDTISKLETFRAERDSLKAELAEQARLNGIGAERELKLMAERDAARQEADKAHAAASKLAAECANLRAELEVKRKKK
jgi:hypothetical protein